MTGPDLTAAERVAARQDGKYKVPTLAEPEVKRPVPPWQAENA